MKLEGIVKEIYEKYGENIIHNPTSEFYEDLKRVCGEKKRDNIASVSLDVQNVICKFRRETEAFFDSGGGEIAEYQGMKYRNMSGANLAQLQDWEKSVVFVSMDSFIRNIGEYSKREELLSHFTKGKLRFFQSGNKSKDTTDNQYGRYSVPGKGRIYIRKKFLKSFKTLLDLRDSIQKATDGYRQILESDIEVLDKYLGIRFELGEILERIRQRVKKCEIYNENRNSRISSDKSDHGRASRCVAIDSNYVSSRIEIIQANLYSEKNIPFLCEEELDLNPGHRLPYKVDFSYGVMVKDCIEKNKVFVEVFGMIDKEGYYGSAYDKMANYSRKGIKIGKNLICFLSGGEKVNSNIMNQVLIMSMYGFIPVDYVIV